MGLFFRSRVLIALIPVSNLRPLFLRIIACNPKPRFRICRVGRLESVKIVFTFNIEMKNEVFDIDTRIDCFCFFSVWDELFDFKILFHKVMNKDRLRGFFKVVMIDVNMSFLTEFERFKVCNRLLIFFFVVWKDVNLMRCWGLLIWDMSSLLYNLPVILLNELLVI